MTFILTLDGVVAIDIIDAGTLAEAVHHIDRHHRDKFPLRAENPVASFNDYGFTDGKFTHIIHDLHGAPEPDDGHPNPTATIISVIDEVNFRWDP